MDGGSSASLWWLVFGGLLAAELLSGTFYLLMLAFGAAVAAVCAHLGLGAGVQVAAAALLGGGATLAWHLRQQQRRGALGDAAVAANPDVHLDIGQQVEVRRWAEDRSTQVHYRGSEWSARLAENLPAVPGPHRIVRVEASVLVLAPMP